MRVSPPFNHHRIFIPVIIPTQKSARTFRHETEFCLICRGKNNVYINFSYPVGQQEKKQLYSPSDTVADTLSIYAKFLIG
jgi:hypothetical protein